MAVDTAAKRLSALHLGSPWRLTLPLPDGTIGQADRQTLTYLYGGISAGAPVAEAPYARLLLVLGIGAD